MSEYMAEIIKEHAAEFPPEIKQWLFDNEHIWVAFTKEAFSAQSNGYKHYSARTIVEYLRHKSMLREKDGEWKINNNVVPYLARLISRVYPEFMKTFFEFRGSPKMES